MWNWLLDNQLKSRKRKLLSELKRKQDRRSKWEWTRKTIQQIINSENKVKGRRLLKKITKVPSLQEHCKLAKIKERKLQGNWCILRPWRRAPNRDPWLNSCHFQKPNLLKRPLPKKLWTKCVRNQGYSRLWKAKLRINRLESCKWLKEHCLLTQTSGWCHSRTSGSCKR